MRENIQTETQAQQTEVGTRVEYIDKDEMMNRIEHETIAIIHAMEVIKSILKYQEEKFTSVEWAVYLASIQEMFHKIINEVIEDKGNNNDK